MGKQPRKKLQLLLPSTSGKSNKNSNSDDKIKYKIKNAKSTATSKNSNMKSNGTNNMINSVNNSVPLKSNNFALNESTSSTYNLPPEMKVTFEKMVSQLDLVTKTIKIFDQRLQNLEGHITTLANRQKKGFVQKQPPQMGDYQYLMENSGSNYIPNNSIRNNDEYQKYTNLNNMDYYTVEIPNQGGTFNEVMNINEENKKNMYKTEIEGNRMNNESSQNQKNENENQNEYMGEIHEEYGYNIGDNQQEQVGDEQYENEQYVEGNGEEQVEQNNEQYGEEYEEMQEEMQEEQYDYEEQYEEGNNGEEEQIEQMEEYQGGENGEEEVVYEYNNENGNEEMDNNNNDQPNQN